MLFDTAFHHMRNGEKIRRRSWLRPDKWIEFSYLDVPGGKRTLVVFVHNRSGKLMVWRPGITDFGASDWEIYKERELVA